jgi:hypothetical protein
LESETGANWIQVNVEAAAFELFVGLHEVIRVSTLPDVEFG